MMQSKVDLDIDGVLEYVKQQSVQIALQAGLITKLQKEIKSKEEQISALMAKSK